jgi:mannose-6-phosphate isomerase-like protein (cupin superfamily)
VSSARRSWRTTPRQDVVVDREREERPWGHYEVLEEAPSHKVKRIEVRPGHRLSYQRHQHRGEHWFVVSGTARVTLEGDEQLLTAGMAIDIPVRAAHRAANPAEEPLVFIEVQHGDSFAEDDIERLEDDFGRG